MIRIKADHKNKRSFISIDNAPVIFRSGIRAGLFEIGLESIRHVKFIIRKEKKTGRLYPFRGRVHRASAPGEAPASMTGRLLRTMGYLVRGSYQCEFGDWAPYGKFLEDGTKNMEPRPHIVRTAREKERDNANILLESVDRKVQRA